MKLDIKYTINYLLDYDIGVPKLLIAGIAIVLGIIIVFYLTKGNKVKIARNASWCILIGYIFFVLSITLLFRHSTGKVHYYLYPLWSYSVLYERMLAELILNVFLFIPIGFFASGALKKKILWNVVGIGFLVSLFIEMTQLITTRGVFNVDDIIHNTLGCVLGFACFVLCQKLMRSQLKQC